MSYIFPSDEPLEETIQTMATNAIARTSPGQGARSTAITDYNLEPRLWLKEIVDAAKKKLYYTQYAYKAKIPQGHGSILIPKRDFYQYSGHSNWAGSTTPGSSITFSKMNNLSGVGVTGTDYNYGISIAYDVIRTNLVDQVKEAREQLLYVTGDAIDQAIVDSIVGATAATSAAKGAQTIYGGDASQASLLTAGDTIETAMVAEVKRKLQSTTCKYWTLGTSEANSTAKKNPWSNDGDFGLFISPFEEETFLTDAQFINAAQYGGNEIVLNGEVGKYLGVKIVVSNNTKEYAASAQHRDGTTNTGIATNCCVALKAQKGPIYAEGLAPTLRVSDYPRDLSTDLIIEQNYGTGILHDDAIVWISVAQE